MTTGTPNYNWQKPVVGADLNVWGDEVNAAFDSADATVKSVETLAASSAGGSFKNRIINGYLLVDQRLANAAVSIGTADTYGPDKWKARRGASAAATLQASLGGGPNTQFPNAVVFAVSTGAAPGSSDQAWVGQDIEGYLMADAFFGSPSAKSLTFTFWVSASAAGTYSVAFQNSAANRAYVATYAVANANTWELKTITIPGDQSGTWLTTNGIGLRVRFDMGSGSGFEGVAGSWSASGIFRTSGSQRPISSTGAQVALIPYQLEVGATATGTENRPLPVETLLCQRYYSRLDIRYEFTAAGTSAHTWPVTLPAKMRATPTASVPVAGSAGNVTSSTALALGVQSGAYSIIPSSVAYTYVSGGVLAFDADF